MAKIHTVEWTPAVIANPVTERAMYANWWGLLGSGPNRDKYQEEARMLQEDLASSNSFVLRILGIDGSQAGSSAIDHALAGIVGSTNPNNYGVPYTLTEEFVAVYRMHPLMRDKVDVYDIGSNIISRSVPLQNTRDRDAESLLNGEHPPGRGRIRVDGKSYTARNGWEALDQRVAFVAEDPAQTMIFRDLTAIDNLCLPAGRKARGFWLNPAYRASCEREYAVHFAPGTLRKYPDALSAQDRHKLVYCRWHLFRPAVVVCIRPYSSVDKTLEEISAQFIGELRAKGIAVLILTSNAAEAERVGKKITLDQKKAPPHPKIAL